MLCPYFKNQGKLKKMVVKKKSFDHQIDELIDCQVITFNNVEFDLSSQLSKKLSQFSLKCLSLIKCRLIDLEYLPKIPTLEALYLDDNLLEVECIGQLKYFYDKLDVLSLICNNINFCLLANCVGSLANFTKLHSLNVIKNFFHKDKQELFDESFYISQRKNFFKYIPTLQLLDCLPHKGNKANINISLETKDVINLFKSEEEQRFYLKYFLKYNLMEGQFEFPEMTGEEQKKETAQPFQELFDKLHEQQINQNDEKDQQEEKNKTTQSSSQVNNSHSLSSNPYGEFNSPQFSKQDSKKKKIIKKSKVIDKMNKKNRKSQQESKSKNKVKNYRKDKSKQINTIRKSNRFK